MNELTEDQAFDIFGKVLETKEKNNKVVKEYAVRSKIGPNGMKVLAYVANEVYEQQLKNLIWFELGGVELFGGTEAAVKEAFVEIKKKGFPVQDCRINEKGIVEIAMLPLDYQMIKDEITKTK